MSNSEYYDDKICIVTGANSGIGYGLSEELLKRGAKVYMAGRNHERVEKAVQNLSEYNDRVRARIADVGKHEQVKNVIEDIVSEEGRLDILFNNAGIGKGRPSEEYTLDDYKVVIDTNLWGVIYGVHTALPIMLKQGFGHIVNTSSILGLVPGPFQSMYSLTKFGVTGYTESLKYEYAEKGIHFSTICPGAIATPIFKKGRTKMPENAYPANKAAVDILDKVSEHRGIIVVPEEPYTGEWKNYVLGEDEILLKYVHDLRENHNALKEE